MNKYLAMALFERIINDYKGLLFISKLLLSITCNYGGWHAIIVKV